jgi:hypothetical protein
MRHEGSWTEEREDARIGKLILHLRRLHPSKDGEKELDLAGR